MNNWDALLNKIAAEWNIPRGNSERKRAWEARIVYSVTGRMAYASLFDNSDKRQTVSIVHMKQRMQNILEGYEEIYPEIRDLFRTEELVNEIYDIFLTTGQCYHASNRVTAAIPQSSSYSNIIFTRGKALSKKENVSGIGTYHSDAHEKNFSVNVWDMFQLYKQDLKTIWKDTVSHAKWTLLSVKQTVDYLRVIPPYSYGYWVDKPASDLISLCRVGEKGNRLYYLYKLEKKNVMVSRLPSWVTEKGNYAVFSNACLAVSHVLPASTYCYDGDLVRLDIHYLLPPPEMNLIRLYSWPNLYLDFPNNFHRILTAKVFEAIKDILELKGYSLKEE